VAALTKREAFDLAERQGFVARVMPEVRASRTVAGLPGPVDLVALAA